MLEAPRRTLLHLGDGRWLLMLALICQVLAISIDGLLDSGPVGSYLFLHMDFTDPTSRLIERMFHALALMGLPLLFFRRMRFLLLIYFAWFFIQPIAIYFLQSSFGHQYSIVAHGARYLLPLALFLISAKDYKVSHRGRLILRLGIALTFIGHGIEALVYHPNFIDYLITFSEQFFKYPLMEEQAQSILFYIGVLDITIGVIIVFFEFTVILGWMIFWGAITAGWRIFYHDYDGFLQLLLRTIHWVGPLFLIYLRNWEHAHFFIKSDRKIFKHIRT